MGNRQGVSLTYEIVFRTAHWALYIITYKILFTNCTMIVIAKLKMIMVVIGK